MGHGDVTWDGVWRMQSGAGNVVWDGGCRVGRGTGVLRHQNFNCKKIE